MNKALNIATWIVGIVGLFALIGFTEAELDKVSLQDVHVNIDTRGGNFFVSQDEIKQAVTDKGYVVDAVTVEEVNIRELESFFDLYPAVKKSEVFKSPDGMVFVNIKQRTPIARIFTKNGESFYLDEDGRLMPLSRSYTSRVPVVNGEIDGSYNTLYKVDFGHPDSLNPREPVHQKLNEVYQVLTYVNQDPLWDAQFTQLYFNEEGDLELVPRVGNHVIVIGNAQFIEDKLNTLRIFYIEGLNKIGWNTYASINLKYKNQVVCTKRTHYGNN